MKLPTEKECLNYFREYKVPKNIFDHCLAVQKVALFLAQKYQKCQTAKELNAKKLKIRNKFNLNLISCLALLHDLFKVATLKDITPDKYHPYRFSQEEKAVWQELRKKYKGLYEGEIAYLIFKNQYPELALNLVNVSNPKKENKSIEELIVHYADWRIHQNKIITLSERIKYLQEAYHLQPGNNVWTEDFQFMQDFEQEFMNQIKIKPELLGNEPELKKLI